MDNITREAVAANMQHFANRLDGIADAISSMTDAEAKADLMARMPREPSMRAAIGGGSTRTSAGGDGSFILGIAKARSRDAQEQADGKALLDANASRYMAQTESVAKSTLGTSDATGGWVLPNALVDDFVKASTFANPYRSLMTVRSGVNSAAVDIPFRSALPTRAVIASFGSTKDNVDLVYNGYTATMYTLARIYDIGNQFLRQSAGAAEKDVVAELATAMGRGEAYYIREGAGSTEPYGYMTALTNGPAAFKSSFSPSATTLAGSVAAAIGTAAGALLSRGRKPEAAVISGTVATLLLTQGTDTAGFFVNGVIPGQTNPNFAPGTLMSPWGIPVVIDADASGTGAIDDNLVVGEWSALRVYLGESYRVDSSDQAGTRWDTNLTGFRGEEELGFDARPAVYAGALQMITDVVP